MCIAGIYALYSTIQYTFLKRKSEAIFIYLINETENASKSNIRKTRSL